MSFLNIVYIVKIEYKIVGIRLNEDTMQVFLSCNEAENAFEKFKESLIDNGYKVGNISLNSYPTIDDGKKDLYYQMECSKFLGIKRATLVLESWCAS